MEDNSSDMWKHFFYVDFSSQQSTISRMYPWDETSERRLLLLCLASAKPDLNEVAEQFGEGVTVKAINHKLARLRASVALDQAATTSTTSRKGKKRKSDASEEMPSPRRTRDVKKDKEVGGESDEVDEEEQVVQSGGNDDTDVVKE
ncbi:hypothetical protein SAICODRAFT_19070 [Saitoella complicata NRRL Y-17804]|uniref:uncharacterized protein n=1 Tax=Saitoella complicata (strain BCRC 22490 / CBS 7301 / JCM 7358 / NBRC 10748 / NRRL Y-17804) TaxID=698492 RepID=UPI000867C120|nr:uncharacterized protein SAICODRAFT_19070 [Saitoella complicata NRRL Y-17804]ODQ53142.1 hypothetical protein SAICODRAFT_19070 [Saitoella complicata NRRL Y-17804]